ncbi:MAG: group 1 truncated hemoglobin [Leptospiraceae bacterium]|nr:group 1 truncated hemoglobin [Leptospiraceae bacterium]
METIFEKLGGAGTFEKVSEYFYSLVLNDNSLKHYFEGKDVKRLQMHQALFLGHVAGGPEFNGKTMEKAHEGLNITEEDFGKVASHLVATLDHFNVPEDIKNTMVNAAAGLKSDIIGK